MDDGMLIWIKPRELKNEERGTKNEERKNEERKTAKNEEPKNRCGSLEPRFDAFELGLIDNPHEVPAGEAQDAATLQRAARTAHRFE